MPCTESPDFALLMSRLLRLRRLFYGVVMSAFLRGLSKYRRRKTGRGQNIELNELDEAISRLSELKPIWNSDLSNPFKDRH